MKKKTKKQLEAASKAMRKNEVQIARRNVGKAKDVAKQHNEEPQEVRKRLMRRLRSAKKNDTE